jgi:hypothetical protein
MSLSLFYIIEEYSLARWHDFFELVTQSINTNHCDRSITFNLIYRQDIHENSCITWWKIIPYEEIIQVMYYVVQVVSGKARHFTAELDAGFL